MRQGNQIRRRFRRRGTALVGLLALAVHLAAFSLAAVMPVTTALAAAEAEPFEIVICTVHGPVVMDARDLGMDTAEGDVPEMPRTACDLAIHSVMTVAIDTASADLHVPVTYLDTRTDRPVGARPAYTEPRSFSFPPRAPPHIA